MKYQTALDYLLSFTDYERSPAQVYSPGHFDLRRMQALLVRLGSPQLETKSIHIVGTKGKGSTAAMIASALGVAGFRAGLFISPHLHTIRERITINGELIGKETFGRLVGRLAPYADEVNWKEPFGSLSTFELLTALAFLYFQEKRVDYQVLEAGMGGRLDATNVVEPEVAIITSISLDHEAILGHTLAEIAREKAGIIKPGSIVVVSPQQPEAFETISTIAFKQGARLIQVGRDVSWQEETTDLMGQYFSVKGRLGTYPLRIPLLGDYQLENAAAAVAALEVLMLRGDTIAEGLARVHWPGRMEILQHSPLLVVDGAHNVYSARRLREGIGKVFPYKQLFLIIGVTADKDIAGIAGELASLANEVLVTQSHHPRAAASQTVAEEFRRRGALVKVVEGVGGAIEEALSLAAPDDLILGTGSLFVIAEAREYMNRGLLLHSNSGRV